MSELKRRLDELKQNVKERVSELDEQLRISEKLEDSARSTQDALRDAARAAQKSAEKLRSEAENGASPDFRQAKEFAESVVRKTEETFTDAARRVRDDFGDSAKKVQENIVQAADKANEKARDISEKIKENGTAKEVFDKAEQVFSANGEKAGENLRKAGEKVGEVFATARTTFESATRTASTAFNVSRSWSNILNSALRTATRTGTWLNENPLQAVGTGFSLLLGLRLGGVFPNISAHWLTHSALPVYGLQKASEIFTKHLETREDLLRKGELSEAEAERVRFERDIVKFVGAPLLGAFSCAAGAVMFAQIFNPKTITGAPISWLLGGNPILEGIWLFGNGIVCFKIGCEFFMIALEDHADVQKIVTEIKGLLPSTV